MGRGGLGRPLALWAILLASASVNKLPTPDVASAPLFCSFLQLPEISFSLREDLPGWHPCPAVGCHGWRLRFQETQAPFAPAPPLLFIARSGLEDPGWEFCPGGVLPLGPSGMYPTQNPSWAQAGHLAGEDYPSGLVSPQDGAAAHLPALLGSSLEEGSASPEGIPLLLFLSRGVHHVFLPGLEPGVSISFSPEPGCSAQPWPPCSP